MMLEKRIKILVIVLAVLSFFIVGGLVVLISPFFPTAPRPSSDLAGTPTPIPLTPTDPKTLTFTSLQKTTIGETTDNQIKLRSDILSTTKVGDVTIYTIKSLEPGETDEIRTQNGIVIYEKTSTETNAAPLPKLTTIQQSFGDPEEIIDEVGEGFYMSAYLYPSQGFAIYVNKYTQSVYEIQRFIPMSLTEYKQNYGSNLSPAPSMPQEFHDINE